MKTPEDRTKLILDYGMMSMILPAHRIWDHDEALQITASTVVWPPKGWREMSFDRKKLTWEHAAMTLEPATNSLININ
jgi:2-keto-3-deoxy-L-rhamnonate aldolase RhmA